MIHAKRDSPAQPSGSALLRNGKGRLTTVDVNPDAGFLIRPPYSDVIELHIGESLDILRELSSPSASTFRIRFQPLSTSYLSWRR
jgi:hypothetical protein